MENNIKIIIVEDKPLMRRALRSFLIENSSFEIIGEAENGRDLLLLLKEIKPEIILLDIEMPVMNGIQALKIINVRYPKVKVIVLSIHKDITTMSECISNGAKGYLTKDCIPEQLITAIIEVFKNSFYIEESISKDVLQNLLTNKISDNYKRNLSKREIQVYNEICTGKSERDRFKFKYFNKYSSFS